MNKATKFTYLLAVWIILLFGSAMLMTYASEYIQKTGFFGDTLKNPSDRTVLFDDAVDVAHDWGARHYWYYWLCVALFILSVVRIVIWSVNYWRENKDSK